MMRLEMELHKSFTLFAILVVGTVFSTTVHAETSVYIVAPGDTLWSIANENLKSPQDWKRLMEFNEMTDASQLQVDQALLIPTEWMKDTLGPPTTSEQPPELPSAAITPAQDNVPSATRVPARAVENIATLPGSSNNVAAIYGVVERLDGGKHVKLALNTALSGNSRVGTGKNSSANIVMKDGSMLVLLANTEVVLSQPLKLERGALEFIARGKQERKLIATKAGTVSAQEAAFRVTGLKGGKQMRVEVEQGTVNVTANGKQHSIGAGLDLLVEAGKAEAQSRPGLLRPSIDNLAKSSVNGEINLEWQPITNAAGYRAQLIYAADSYLVLVDQELSRPGLNWNHINPGHYKIRLRSVDDKGFEGLNAELAFVVQGKLNPPHSNSPVDGATLPNDKPWIAWSRVPEAYSYVLQVASDSRFRKNLHEITYVVNNYYKFEEALPAGDYYWRVMSVSAKQAKSVFGDVRKFTVK
jgi:LysM repeat protein